MIYAQKNYNDLIQKTAQLVRANKNLPTLVLCEDKITLSLEMEITRLCGGSFFCEVTTLNRLMHRLSSLKEVCSKQTISLIIKKLLSQFNEELTIFKNVNSYSLAGNLAEVIAQLKSAKVTPKDLLSSADNFSGAFKNKLKDIAFIFDKYEEYLTKENLLDTNNKFSLFVPLLKDFPLEKYNVIVTGFQSVTTQTASLFNLLLKRVKRLDFVLLYGQENLYVNEMYNFCKGLNLVENKQAYPLTEGYHILDNLFNPVKKTRLYSDKIGIYSYLSEESEIIDVAKQIKSKVIKGAKYSDFMFISCNLNQNKQFIKKTFTDYEIPYFLEENFNLSNHPLVRAICSYIDFKYKKFDLSLYKKCLREASLFPDINFVNSYVTFLTKNSYSATSFLKGLDNDQESLLYKDFREFTLSLAKFYPEDSATDFANNVIKLLQQTSAKDNLQLLANQLLQENKSEEAEFVTNGYDYVLSILEEIKKVLKQEKISAREFKSLFLSGATYTEFAIIPQGGDRVYVGDFNGCKYRYAKHLYICGLSSSVPNTKEDTSLLTDGDLRRLDKIKLIIEPKIDLVNSRTKENIGVCLSNFSDSLTLTYSTTLQGKENLPSEIISEVCDMFEVPSILADQNGNAKPVPLKVISKSLLEKYYLQKGKESSSLQQFKDARLEIEAQKYLSRQVAIKTFALELSNYKYLSILDGSFASLYEYAKGDQLLKDDLDKIISSLNAQLTYEIVGSGDLFFPNNKVSATTIESYYACPYANFLNNGLKLKRSDDGELNALNIGTFLHSVYENFEKLLSSRTSLSESDLEELANQLIDELLSLDEYKKFTKKAVYENLFALLKQEVLNLFKILYLDSKKSAFKPKYFEYAFGFDNKVKGLKIKTKQGEYEVRGKIDRVDFADNLVRIIDYKTGSTANFESEDKLFSGNKLQLYLYLNVFLEQNYLPAGVYYAPMNNEYLSYGKQAEKTLKGKTVNSEDILYKTDSAYKDGSTILDLSTDKKGKIKNCINADTLVSFCKYAKMVTAKAIEKIKQDKVLISPTEDACKYCKFGGICGFVKEKFDSVRRSVQVNPEDIQKIVEEQNE